MAKKDDIKKIIDECLYIDIDRQQPIPVITIQQKTIATETNFITINGLPKSRKTSFMNFFIYSALSNTDYLGIKVNLSSKDKICLIDTEQSVFDFSRQVSMLKKLLRTKNLPSKFNAYLFRKYEPAVILNSIYTILSEQKPKLIFIDNLTELVINPNDMNEAKTVIQFLKKITTEFNCVIVCLLHLGKGNLQTLGNLGSMADRAAQSVLRVVYDSGTTGSTLEPVMLRSDQHFEPITIVFNNDTKLYEQITTEKKQSKKFVLDSLTPIDHDNRLRVIFNQSANLTYAELVESVKQVYGVGANISKQQIIPYLVGNHYLSKDSGIYQIKTNKK